MISLKPCGLCWLYVMVQREALAWGGRHEFNLCVIRLLAICIYFSGSG